MTEILLTNVFFGITAAAVIVFTAFLCAALYYLIRILRVIRSIVERVDHSSEAITEDFKQLRRYVIEGSLLSQALGLFVGRKRRRAEADDEEEV